MATDRQRIEQLLADYEPEVRRAFLEAVDHVKSSIVLKQIIAELEVGNIEEVVNIASVSENDLSAMEIALITAFHVAGRLEADRMRLRDSSNRPIRSGFSMSNPIAEERIRNLAGQTVTNISDSNRTALRNALADAFARNDTIDQIVQTLTGSVNRVTGRRQGGIIGLDTPRMQRLVAVEQAMKTPEGVRSLVIVGNDGVLRTRYQVNKATALRIFQAYHTQTAVPESLARLSTIQYGEKLLKERAAFIASEEVRNALLAAKMNAWQQAIDRGDVQSSNLMKTWLHTPQEHPRLQHMAMHNVKIPFDEQFRMFDGTLIDYPRAPGIPSAHSFNCKCGIVVSVNEV